MWQRLQPREKIMMVILGACVVIFGLFYFLLIPQYDAFARNREALLELEARAKAAEDVVASERAESELAASATEKLNQVKPIFNNQMTDGLALTHIGLEAMSTNVRIDSYVPSGIIDKSTYLELPVKFEVSGDYPNVVYFIQKMEGLPNLSDLRSLKIQPEKEAAATDDSVQSFVKSQLPDAPGSNQSGRVTATFDLVIYSSVTPEAQLKLEQEAGWQVGRQNAFQTPGGGVSPLSSIETPTQTNEAPLTSEEDLLSNFIKQLLEQGAPSDNNTLPGSSGTVELETTPNNNQE